jgi:ferredoxin
MPHLIQNTCTKCGACLQECPTTSIIVGAKQFHIDIDTCDDSAACAQVCPVDAIVPMIHEEPTESQEAADDPSESEE